MVLKAFEIPETVRLGDRVSFHRSDAPSGGLITGYVRRMYDYHGAPKLRVESNGRVYAALVSELVPTPW